MKIPELGSRIKSLFRANKGERFFTESALLSALFEKNGLRREDRLLHPSLEIPPDCAEKILSDCERLLGGYPLQYYLGTEFFDGREFLVSENVLIPRADSEILVETAAELLSPGDSFFDFCCGSGCLGIAVLLRVPQTRLSAFDLSESALALTRKNCERFSMGERMTTEKLDVLSNAARMRILAEKPRLVIANPPYISRSEMALLDENVLQEPRMALFGGEDGLDFYRRFLEFALVSDSAFVLEIGAGQRAALQRICDRAGIGTRFLRDRAEHDRCLVLEKK